MDNFKQAVPIKVNNRFTDFTKIGSPHRLISKRTIKEKSPNNNILKWASKNKSKIFITKDPREAVKNADCIMTDKWISMNDKVNKKEKKKSLKDYQVNNKLLKLAKSDCIFMHCLPVGRGEEVTDEIIDGEKSVVWQQASNRVHAQKSIINWCLN